QQIFILEQTCLYPDIDGYDPKALHFFLYEEDFLAGYLRIFPPKVKFEESALGRIVVHPQKRGTEVGKMLIRQGMEHCFEAFPNSGIRIEAQAALEKYYNQFGFISEGEVYVVDD